jgi:hypothetical protein
MKYAFKMMTVVLALGVLVGCESSNKHNQKSILNLIDNGTIQAKCKVACSGTYGYNAKKAYKYYLQNDYNSLGKLVGRIGFASQESQYYIGYVAEKRNNLKLALQFYQSAKSADMRPWSRLNLRKKINEGLNRVQLKLSLIKYNNKLDPKINLNPKFLSWNNEEICGMAINKKTKIFDSRKKYLPYVSEAKNRGLDCKVNKNNKTFVEKEKNYKFKDKFKPSISSEELEKTKREADELRKKLTALENKQKQDKKKINKDNQKPIINAYVKINDANAIVSGRVTDNIYVAEVLIDGQAQQLSSNGTFKIKFYIPRTGKTVKIVAFDIKGNKASKLLKIERGNVQQASGPVFDTLNPSGKTVKSNLNALALIIGVADYSRTNANALYADKDAQQFYDYATMKLGIPSANIKELVNEKADRVEIGLAVQDWIARSTKSGKTDIYIFFAGHGLASDDGKNMFLLPYDGSPRLLKASAIRRKELFDNIQQSNPRSVTVFLDTCYSGTTRGTDMLVASRPIMIKAKEQSIPNNFTVFSAAAGDQTSKPLEEAKHGMFSYFLMKGMEGDADTNNDNKITARELHTYVEQNVVQQSSGSQTPELQGDKDRVLVQFN